MVRHFGRVEADTATGLSGRSQILRLMRSMDVLLLLHGTEPICAEYIPSKLYEYLWMQRPILAMVHENPQMASLLQAANHNVVMNAQQLEVAVAKQVVLLLQALWEQWRNAGLHDNHKDSQYTTAVSAKHLFELATSCI